MRITLVGNCDAIVVLGGGITDADNLTDVSKRRVEKGAELLQKRYAEMIIFSGAWSFLSDKTHLRTEASAMRDYAIKLGVAAQAILLEDKSKDTLGNAYFTRKTILEPRKWKTIAIVTSDFHAIRTEYIFKKVLGPEYNISIFPATSELSEEALKQRQNQETRILAFTKKWLDEVPDGNMREIEHILFSEHPAYAPKPKFSIEQMREIIHEITHLVR